MRRIFLGLILVIASSISYSVFNSYGWTVSIRDIGPTSLYLLGVYDQNPLEKELAPLHLNKTQHIIIILVDGLGYYQLKKANEVGFSTPFINNLAANGIFIKAHTVYPPVTITAHTALFQFDHSTIFEKVSENGMKAIVIFGPKIEEELPLSGAKVIIPKDYDGDGTAGDNDVSITSQKVLKNDGPNLLFIHLSVDSTAHRFGPYSEKSFKDIKKTDAYIGMILRELKKLDLYKDAIVIVTADHGLHKASSGGAHGTILPDDMTIPIIFCSISKLT